MAKEHISCSISADGTMLGCPARIVFGNQNGQIAFYGAVQWEGRKLSDALAGSDVKLPEDVGNLVGSLLPDCFPQKLSVSYWNNRMTIEVQDKKTYFKLVRASGNMALLFAFEFAKQQEQASDSSLADTIKNMLKKVAGFFGIKEFIFYGQTGKQSFLPQMLEDRVQMKQLPQAMQANTMLLYTQINFSGNSIFCKGIRSLFGVQSTELYLGIAGKTTCMITLPEIRTCCIESNDLYMLLTFGKIMQFVIRGCFVFPYLKGMEFWVDCGVTETSFRLEALAHVEEPIDLFGPFSIGDTCMMIQAGNGLEIGMYSSLYIRNIQLFGAVMLKVAGNVVEPTLLSAAFSDISIPILVDNLLGEHLDGIEALDFIRIEGLPFQEINGFPMEILKKKDIAAIVSQFNTEVKSEFLQLDETQVQITPFGEGVDLADLKRMRHYYINQSGKLQLAAQFYFALENTTLGNYSIERGYFICGVIEIFKKRFEVLFSFRESEGVLAYAKIPAMDLGFIRVGPSEFQENSDTALPIPADSILAQFVNPNQEGIVFFLSAGKKEVSFYLDGSVEILRLFRLDARIMYMNRKISVDLCTKLYGIFGISLHLQVDYASFSSGNFEFTFMLDTSGLTEKLTAVTKKIDEAIHKLREKIDNAKREVDKAQNHVNELYGQISCFDGKIAECKKAIAHASWWKKAFVTIAKGLEIGAYEVAKAGIYTAIGLATAALQVAKGILNISDKVGEGVLKAVNAVISGAMSLFYINYIRLDAKANLSEQYFMAEIDFVVLGKQYNLSKKIGKAAMEQDTAGALSSAINEHIDSDISHMEDGSFRRLCRNFQAEQFTLEESSRQLDQAKEHLMSSVKLMKSMQDTYVEELQIPLEECDEMNVSMIQALGQVESVLKTGVKAGNIAALGNAMGGMKRSVAAQEKKGVYENGEISEKKDLIARYDQAREVYDKVLDNVKFLQKQRADMEKHHENVYEKVSVKEAANGNSYENMGTVVRQVKQQMYEAFPMDREGTDFINLSRETALHQYFVETEKRLGLEPEKKRRVLMSRSSRDDHYQNRL